MVSNGAPLCGVYVDVLVDLNLSNHYVLNHHIWPFGLTVTKCVGSLKLLYRS